MSYKRQRLFISESKNYYQWQLHVTRKDTLDKIADYISKQGYRVLEKDFSENIIRFSDGSIEAIIRIVDEEANGGDILSTVIQSAFDAASGKVAYVALPIHLLSRIGDHAFRLHKIGLIVYSDQKITELVGGSIASFGENQGSINDLEKIETLIDSLSSRLERVEESISSLSMIDELNRRLEILEQLVYKNMSNVDIKTVETSKSERPKIEIYQKRSEQKVKRSKTDNLPSFIAENPWVDLLSEKT